MSEHAEDQIHELVGTDPGYTASLSAEICGNCGTSLLDRPVSVATVLIGEQGEGWYEHRWLTMPVCGTCLPRMDWEGRTRSDLPEAMCEGGCGRLVYGTTYQREPRQPNTRMLHVCSKRCRRRVLRNQKKDRRLVQCHYCGEDCPEPGCEDGWFMTARSHATTCGPTCRQREWRARRKTKTASAPKDTSEE